MSELKPNPKKEKWLIQQAASREISFTEGYKVNTKLYKKMFAGAPVNQIVAEINNEFGQRILYNITAAGYRKLRKEQH